MANLKTFIAKAASGEPLSRAEASAGRDACPQLAVRGPLHLHHGVRVRL